MEGKGAWIEGRPVAVFENRIGVKNGETVAVSSHPKYEGGFVENEKELYKDYLAAKHHNARMPDDLKALSQFDMEQTHAARKAIQAYKTHPKINIPLDTPPVDLEDPYAENDAAANDSVYDQNNVADLNLDL